MGRYCIVSRKRGASGVHRRGEFKVAAQMMDTIVVLVTCGSLREARTIARKLVERRLAACGNVVEAPVRSIYRWKDTVESAKEFLLVLKSSRQRFAALEAAVQKLHSYDVPEILALPVSGGARAYLDWIAESLAGESRRAPRQR
jgi:periplasmic divalent cation tolerance protein